ncbi:MAG: ComF family protein [Ignavibacteriales bacterium]|nr:ComF family protein [Ignavibacteriales bacterium]
MYVQTRTRLLDSAVVDDFVSVFVFEKEGTFQTLAHALKYEGFQSAGRMIGGVLGEQMNEWGIGADAIVPVPLHRAKHRERGFNQAESIARGISDRTGWPVVTGVLERTRPTQTQTKLDAVERQKNVEGAFAVRKKMHGLGGKTCIIVDDVITTGATIVSCAHALRSAGASTIIASSAALAEYNP